MNTKRNCLILQGRELLSSFIVAEGKEKLIVSLCQLIVLFLIAQVRVHERYVTCAM